VAVREEEKKAKESKSKTTCN